MKTLGTFARALTLEAVNGALGNAQVQKVAELVLSEVSFAQANVATVFSHGLGRRPQFAFFLPEGTAQLEASAADKAEWDERTITLRVTNAPVTGILAIGGV